MEQAITIGESTQLCGVLSRPVDINIHKPLVIVINSGLLRRTGPFRLYVNLCRKIVETGLAAYRFDLSGIGDSERRNESMSRESQHFKDIEETLDFFEKTHSIHTFIIMGICTGADNCHRAMVKDERIIGAVCIDGYSYPTLKYYQTYYLQRLFKLSVWKNLIKRLVFKSNKVATVGKADRAKDERKLNYRWTLPDKSRTRADYQKFIKRGARLLCVFTASWPYNYQNQMADAFRGLDFSNTISLEFMEDAEHTFPIVEDRKILINKILLWLNKYF